ncbi:MAG: PAS domain S-box protein [Candidatus Hodarchaeota archaeon]
MKDEEKNKDQLIKELMEVRQQLESEQKFRRIFEQSFDGMVLTDEQGIIIEWNHSLEQISGLKKEEVINKALWDIQFDLNTEENKTIQFYEQLKAEIQNFIKTGQATWANTPNEQEIVRPDEVHRILETVTFPIKTPHGFMGGGILRDITGRKQADEIKQKQLQELNEHVKELNCLYQVSKLIADDERPVDEILQEIVEVLPPAWQFSDVTCASILLGGREYKTSNFQNSPWNLSADIIVSDKKNGEVEIYYLEEKPIAYEGPFLKEERKLIDGLARELANFVKYRRTKTALRGSEEQLETMFGLKKEEDLPEMSLEFDPSESIELDSTDQAILKELQGNARLSMRKLSEQVHIPSTTIFNRIRRLKDKNIIQGFTTILGSKATQGTNLLILRLTVTQEQDQLFQGLMGKTIGEYIVKRFPNVLSCVLTEDTEIHLLLSTNTNVQAETLLQQIREVPHVKLVGVGKSSLLLKGQRLFTLETIQK